MWYFYCLESLTRRKYFYKGSTNNLRRRLQQHNNGEVISTKPYRPYRIVYIEGYLSKSAAIKRELSVKKSGSVSVPLLKRITSSLYEE